MKVIDRYFTKQLIGIFIMLLLILTGLAWMVQIMSMMKFLLNYGIELTNFLGLTVMMIPFILSVIVPFVTFISVVFVYNKLIGDNEIVVIAGAGYSPARIARPAIILAGILTIAHLFLNVWIVPITQAKFYDTQWNLRYGLAHLKLQEAAFTEMSHGLVVYVDKVSGQDLNNVMLSDMRDNKSQMAIFAQNGKLVNTMRGLSIVMSNGSLLMQGSGKVIGSFDNFDMDLSITEKNNNNTFKARRMPTLTLVKAISEQLSPEQHKTVLGEISTRVLSPFMNMILAILAATVLLRSSLLRRRASFAPAIAVVIMVAIMAAFMSASTMLWTIGNLIALAVSQVVVFGIIGFMLVRK
jgi:LPS export ABC transporter permease LptF